MCTVCGCGPAVGLPIIDNQRGSSADRHHRHEHHADGRVHDHDHAHDPHDHDPHDHDPHDHGHHDHGHHHPHHEAADVDAAAAPAVAARRLVRVEQDILAENDRLAARNRAVFEELGVVALNLMSAPGSGKTTLLVRTITDLQARLPVGVIEGDQETSFDADRIRAAGVAAVQVNTGKGCHLDAGMVARALPELAPPAGAVVFIENVGNLVCPAGFDLGENARVVLLSVTEGDDKPLKYANMFAAAELMLLTKIDLLPFVPFDMARCAAFARRVNPRIDILPVSATSGEGLRQWYDWIERRRATPRTAAGTDG